MYYSSPSPVPLIIATVVLLLYVVGLGVLFVVTKAPMVEPWIQEVCSTFLAIGSLGLLFLFVGWICLLFCFICP